MIRVAACIVLLPTLMLWGCNGAPDPDTASAQTAASTPPPQTQEAQGQDESDSHDHAHDDQSHDHGEDEHGHDHGEADHDLDHAEDEHDHDATAEIALTAQAVKQYGITIETARPQELQPTFTVPGRVGFNAEAMAHVGSPLPGRVSALSVRLGDEVQVGDPLMEVQSAELGAAQSEFLIRRAAAEAAAPAVDLAKSALDRAQGLYESSQGITLAEVQRRDAEHRAAVAALKSAEAEAMAAENRLHLFGMTEDQVEAVASTGEVLPKFTIASPIAGQVIQREVTLGELVNPERDALMVIADLTTLWVLAHVPEARMAEVAPGAAAWINAGSIDPHRHEGTVSYIAPMVDPTTRTVTIRIEVHCEDGSLKPGNFVQVEIAGNGAAAADGPILVVPEEAIQEVEGRALVFVPVADEANTFVARPVSIGRPVGGHVPVWSGLTAGEKFVASGSFILKAEIGKGAAGHEH